MLQWGAFATAVHDLVPANSEPSAMGFILLRTIVATDLTISCLFVFWHVLFAKEKISVSAFDVAYSLKQATKFVCKAVLPNGMVGFGFDEVAIPEYIASDVVNDGSNCWKKRYQPAPPLGAVP